MNKRALIEYYIGTVNRVHKREDYLKRALESINRDNFICSLVPDDIWHLLEVLLKQILSEAEVDWVMWYMYERSSNCRGVSDDTGCMDIETFDEFYKFAIENKTVSEIQSEK